MEPGICKMFSNLKFFLRINICNNMRKTLNMIVKFPSVNGKFRLKTYGMDEIGDVPRLAFVTRLTPSAFINSPTKNKRYLFNCVCVPSFSGVYHFLSAFPKYWLNSCKSCCIQT